MASELEKLVAAKRKESSATTGAQVSNIQGMLESSLGDLLTEQGEVAPMYDNLKRDAQRTYEDTLQSARYSASDRGVFRSGILSNQELKFGQSYSEITSNYDAERTRKLADISRRRTLMKKQANEEIKNTKNVGAAGMEAYISDIRYKDYLQKQEQAAADRRAASSNALGYANLAWDKQKYADSKKNNTVSSFLESAKDFHGYKVSEVADQLKNMGININAKSDKVITREDIKSWGKQFNFKDKELDQIYKLIPDNNGGSSSNVGGGGKANFGNWASWLFPAYGAGKQTYNAVKGTNAWKYMFDSNYYKSKKK